MKYKLNLIEFSNKTLFRNVRVEISKKKLAKLRSKIEQRFGSIQQFIRYAKLKNNSTFYYYLRGERDPKLFYFVKIVKILKEDEDIFEHIISFRQGNRGKRVKLPKEIVITPEFVEGFSLYRGDGIFADASRRVCFTSSNKKLIFFFINWLSKNFNIEPENLHVYIHYINEFQRKYFEKLLHRIGIKNIRSYHSPKLISPENKKEYERNNSIINIAFNSKFLFKLLKKIEHKVEEIVLSDKEIALAYIKGIFAAEGSCNYNNKNGTRIISLSNKNKHLVNFVSKLLLLYNIQNYIYKKGELYCLEITGKNNLMKFFSLNCFGHYKAQQSKLKEIIKSYKQEYYGKDAEEYYLQFISNMDKNGEKITTGRLMKYSNRSRTQTYNMLRRFVNKDILIKVGKRGRLVCYRFK